ncbi:acyltransferase family protein [Zunongwangia sp. F363]|uniref:Acyltransferase family protein n=1 Tax=Autumnicola tepida TaxID=3075595 RepID=A0ABU3CCA8_9FLAO|nr:acyltransferase family protein [Zunongwangia sp. F363]MDT0643964.1 acyltransferase family protein [Zunongwangia sp. F363]
MKNVRRYDLDWLRVLVFALLIIYHVGMFFVPWEWHIKNNEISESLTIPMLFLNQWRIPLLFIISGMGTCFALSKRTWWQFVKERHNRLMVPLLVGMIVVVAPQVYIERILDGSATGNYLDFYLYDYFTKKPYPEGNFSWHHLWFLPYLFIYSILLSPVFILFRKFPQNIFVHLMRKLISTKGGIFLLLLPLLLIFLLLEPLFPVTHSLVGDWYYLALNFIFFFYGYLFISFKNAFWKMVNRCRKTALAIGMISFFIFILSINQPETNLQRAIYVISKFLNIGSWIIAIFGYAAKYLNRKSKLVQYCNRAVYPFYIFHQTVTVVAAYYLYDKDLMIGIKFIILTIVTFLVSWLLFEIVKRSKITCILFGIKPRKDFKGW